MDQKTIYSEFHEVIDTEAQIQKWIEESNDALRGHASLEEDAKPASGRHHAEKVLELRQKKGDAWNEEDYEFAARVVSYAKRSAGIAREHGHNKNSEVGDSGMTKNEIARRNWGLPAQSKA